MIVAVLYCGSSHIKSLIDRLRAGGTTPVVFPSDVSCKVLDRLKPKGVIISGSPWSVLDPGAPEVDMGVYELTVPVLGICYGMQRMAVDLGGQVVRYPSMEKGLAHLALYNEEPSLLYRGFTLAGVDVWMAHSCQVQGMPEGFSLTGSTKETEVASFERKLLFGVQFHPEKEGNGSGRQVLTNFISTCRAVSLAKKLEVLAAAGE